jgi:V/A-type H+/Na+-transporting ATPase subunit I
MIVPMQKVAILSHKSFTEDVIDLLQSEGVVDIQAPKEVNIVDHTEVQFHEADLKFAIQTLKERAEKHTLLVAQKKSTIDDIKHAALHTDVLGIIERLRTLEASDTDAQHVINDYHQKEMALQPWENLSWDLSQSRETPNTRMSFGSLPVKDIRTVEEYLRTNLPQTHVEQVSTGNGHVYCACSIWKEDQKTFEEVVTKHGWTDIELPTLEGTPAEILKKAFSESREALTLREKNENERRQLSVDLPNLLKVQIFVNWLNGKQDARESSIDTNDTSTLFGWVPKTSISSLEKKLCNLSPATAILKVKPDANETPPVLLKNSLAVTPFESVTNLYGLPLASEMDPTMSLAPFFILYFALCLTDAGYGAVLAILFGLTVFITKKSIADAPLLWLLFFGGIVTFLVSILFGGWFGLTPAQMPSYLTYTSADGQLLFKGQIWNLSHQSGITFLQNLSLGLGLAHLSFGMFLAGWHKWIHNKKMEALWVDFTNHLLIGSTILCYFLGLSPYFLIPPLALFIWGKGYGSAWYVRPIVGLLGLVNFAISMLSNTLSYLRLLALGLVTGALAMAVNMVAVEIGKLFPIYLAIPIVITICVVGHLVSIALNTLGSFIHSGRLQFIEFFSQFFEGGGRPFNPLRRSL